MKINLKLKEKKDNLKMVTKKKIRLNTLEVENETLKGIIKDKLYKDFINKINEPNEIDRLKETNKKLRLKNKELREKIKEVEHGKSNQKKNKWIINTKKKYN